jgi:hypothetical protein
VSPFIRMSVALCIAAAAAGCTVYEVAPGVYSPAQPATFDRSWSAVIGAFQDQGVQLLAENRGAGVVTGRRGRIDVTANVRSQADGSVRVQFDTAGATADDPALIQRVSQSYDRRMGR